MWIFNEFFFNFYAKNTIFLSILSGKTHWNTENLENVNEIRVFRSFLGHLGPVKDIAISRNSFGKLVSAGLSDKTLIVLILKIKDKTQFSCIKVWDLSQGYKISSFGADSEINCIELDLNEDFAFIACKNQTIFRIKINPNSQYFDAKKTAIVSQKNSQKMEFCGHK